MDFSQLIILLFTLLAGGIAGWLWRLRWSLPDKTQNIRLREQLSQLEQNQLSLNQRLTNQSNQIEALRQTKELLSTEKTSIETELRLLKIRFIEQQNEIADLSNLKTQIIEIQKTKAIIEANLSAEKDKIIEQQNQFTQLKAQLKTEFSLLANEILEHRSQLFTSQSKKEIGDLLAPMKERLEQFKKQVSDSYQEEVRERFSLKNEIVNLLTLNKSLAEEAQNLTKALKGENKTQGDWGEMILENILEKSGLSLGREYFVQQNLNDEDENRFRPDVIVKYPGDRCVLIDSKVSLKHYEAYANAKDINEQKIHLKAHLESVKRHVKELSAKNYQNLLTDCESPEFVMMFLPIEPAYLIAIQNDSELWSNAFQKHILLISPTNLIAALRMIAALWEHDKQNKNVLKIAEESGKLIDKFYGFLEDFDNVGKYLKQSSEAFETAKNKIKEGKGNIVGRAQLISQLGAKAKKTLPSHYQDTHEE
jgi:DNA recombination protein RmuC